MARNKKYYVCSYNMYWQHNANIEEIQATKKQIKQLEIENKYNVYYDNYIDALYFVQN